MYTVYGMSFSGNCYKVRLLLEQLGQAYRWVEVDVTQGDTRTPDFLAMNPNGKVPTLQLPSGECLPESNAILCYLADGTRYWPTDRWARAQTLQWMFFEQYSHEPFIAVARFINTLLPGDHARRAELPRLLERGYQALQVMEGHLRQHDFFVAGEYTIADIALFAYTHVAADGGFDLEPYPEVRAWLSRVQATAKFVPMSYRNESDR